MGCFNSSCSLTDQDIRDGDVCAIIPMKFCRFYEKWVIIGPAFTGSYDDYGGFHINESPDWEAVRHELEAIHKPNAVEAGKTLRDYNQFHDYMNKTIDDLLSENDLFNAASGGKLRNTYGEKIQFMAIKIGAWNLLRSGKFADSWAMRSINRAIEYTNASNSVAELIPDDYKEEVRLSGLRTVARLMRIDPLYKDNTELLDKITEAALAIRSDSVFDAYESVDIQFPLTIEQTTDILYLNNAVHQLNREFKPYDYAGQKYDIYRHFRLQHDLALAAFNESEGVQEYDPIEIQSEITVTKTDSETLFDMAKDSGLHCFYGEYVKHECDHTEKYYHAWPWADTQIRLVYSEEWPEYENQ